MILSTTPSLEGKTITHHFGIVTGEVVTGANYFRDLFAVVRDIAGGRSAAYEKELTKARETAISIMVKRAELLGANAITGINIDYEALGGSGSMLMVSVTGTAILTN